MDIKESPFYTQPEKFLKLDQRVRAKVRVYDLPTLDGQGDQGPVHAEPGEEGVVVHVEKGYWPTVRFDRTRTASCVTDFEVEALEHTSACPHEPCGKCGISTSSGAFA